MCISKNAALVRVPTLTSASLPPRLPPSSVLYTWGNLHALVYLSSCFPMATIPESQLKHSSHLKVVEVVSGRHRSVSNGIGTPGVHILNEAVPSILPRIESQVHNMNPSFSEHQNYVALSSPHNLGVLHTPM